MHNIKMKLPYALIAIIASTCFAPPAYSSGKYSTPTYELSIERSCAEGMISCDNVHMTLNNKNTKESISIIGSTVHTTCADGVTPCRFLGYKFQKDDLIYIITNQHLTIQKSKKEIVSEEFILSE